jgi:hypothetical protein
VPKTTKTMKVTMIAMAVMAMVMIASVSAGEPTCRDQGDRVSCGSEGTPCDGSLTDAFYNSRGEVTFCNEGLFCNSTTNVCQEEEEVVNSQEGDRCGPGNKCSSNDGTVWKCKNRQCVNVIRIPTLSGKRRIGDDCTFNRDCYGNLTCSDAKECSGFALGELCHGNWDCASGVCDQYECVAKLKAGADCDIDRECESNKCKGGKCFRQAELFSQSNGENCTYDYECSTSSYCWTNSSAKANSECRSYDRNTTIPCGNATWGTGQTCQTAGLVPGWSTLNARQSVCTCRNQNSDAPTCEEVSDCRSEWQTWVEAMAQASIECGAFPPNSTNYTEPAWQGDCYNARVSCAQYNLMECIDENREDAYYSSVGMSGLNCLPVRAVRENVCNSFEEIQSSVVSVQFSVIASLLAVLAARLF